MKVTLGRSGSGLGSLFLLGLIVAGFVAAMSYEDIKRYLRIRNM